MSNDYSSLSISYAGAIATVTINHGPVNILDTQLMKDLYKAGKELEANQSVKVIIFDSANPDFFIAHADVNMIRQVEGTPAPDGKTPSMLQSMFELYRNMPKVTIGKVKGIARGGGSEFLLSLDMRFGAIGQAVFGQPEVGLGLIAGGGGCVRLPRLVGRSRAMEILLGCDDFNAELAERYGYINRAVAADKIDEFVARLAERIAIYPQHAIALTKKLVNDADQTNDQDFANEYSSFYQSATHSGMAERMKQAMEVGLQTPEVEKGDLHDVIVKLDA